MDVDLWKSMRRSINGGGRKSGERLVVLTLYQVVPLFRLVKTARPAGEVSPAISFHPAVVSCLSRRRERGGSARKEERKLIAREFGGERGGRLT